MPERPTHEGAPRPEHDPTDQRTLRLSIHELALISESADAMLEQVLAEIDRVTWCSDAEVGRPDREAYIEELSQREKSLRGVLQALTSDQ
jgi:hypothetical protein